MRSRGGVEGKRALRGGYESGSSAAAAKCYWHFVRTKLVRFTLAEAISSQPASQCTVASKIVEHARAYEFQIRMRRV